MSPIIEHLVLFKVCNSAHPSKIDAMVSSQRCLSTLDFVPHLAAGPIHRLRSPAADFTHLLHSRFRSKPDLASYAIHPSHLAVVHQNAPVIEDVFAVDWVADLDGDIVPSPGSGMRFLIAKPREGIPAAEIVKAIDGVRTLKVSCGVNFSQGRAKGYDVCLLLGFRGVEEMDGMEGEEEIEAIKEKIRDLIDGVIVVDFVVPSSGL
ncbi:stress-response A/B barrel domain-containing protein UP3-like [Phalaenopsis equestris]|uniref:stress-response A/B barrel domain-containing protein UP3-like n=1 Tax=Phalaenopsis equestris TaxID=78828 RepID=UPI0009E4442C|nr:stress-response A/B barrel domain-containing protein UP3-like [Phalaenopsis equestris]